MILNITAPYTALESFLYDRYIAPAALELNEIAFGRTFVSLPKGASLLDVGCGGGHFLVGLARERPDLELTGIDLSRDQVERARRRLRPVLASEGASVQVIQGSALDLPFPENAFEAVVSIASLKHWTDRLQGIKECVRVLKPGGKLYMLEARSDCDRTSVDQFVRMWRIPKSFRELAARFFMTKVAGPSLDRAEAARILKKTGCRTQAVRTLDSLPAIVMIAEK